MRCFICNRTQKQILLIKLPYEAVYENVSLTILGNLKENEYICLACMGYQFDEMRRKKEKVLI